MFSWQLAVGSWQDDRPALQSAFKRPVLLHTENFITANFIQHPKASA